MKPYFEQNGISIYHGDCREVLPQLSERPTLVLSSPPYPGAEMWDATTDELYALNEAALKASAERLADGGVLAWQVADVPNGNHGVLTTTTTTQYVCHNLGLTWRSHIIWDKGVTDPLPPLCFRRRPALVSITHEHILVFHKGDWVPREKQARKSLGGAWRVQSTWRIQPDVGRKTGHKAAFPALLAERAIDLWSLEGETVLDPFLGSGTTLVAAKKMQRRGIGIEIEERYAEMAARNLEQGVLPLVG